MAQMLNLAQMDLPACPETLVKLSLLLADPNGHVESLAAVIETDMALAAAVVRAVNSALIGLAIPVETVHEAVRYLGMREVAGLTFEMGLRAAFPPGPFIEQIWSAASQRGLLMGRLAQHLGLANAFFAHTAGLFAESGRAIFYVQAPQLYQPPLATPAALNELLDSEARYFGLTYADMGVQLCQHWGLAADIASYVQQRQASWPVWSAQSLPVRQLLGLGGLVDQLMIGATEPEPIDYAAWAQLMHVSAPLLETQLAAYAAH